MATIAIAVFPEFGHLNATLKLAKGLKSRNHRVYYLGLRDFEEPLARQGQDLLPVFEEVFPRGAIHQRAVSQQIETFEAILLEAARRGGGFDPLQEFNRVIHEIGPDLLLIDILLPGMALMAKRAGVRVMFFNTMLYSPWQGPDPTYRALADLPELILCPQEFDFAGRPSRDRTFYVEAAVDLQRREVAFPWERLSPTRPLAYCSLGTQAHLRADSCRRLRTVIAAFSAQDEWQAIISTGMHSDIEEFGAVPSHVILVQSAPQLALLKKAAVVITHGGLNTVKEAIYFGVPMIVFPLMRDQPAVAARVTHHGLGVRGNLNEVSVELIHSLVNQVGKQPGYRARVRAMSERFQELEEAGKSFDIIESLSNRCFSEV